MIFSKFFKAKWQSKQSVTRIQAVNDELDPNNAQHKTILLNLLEQDPDNLVRRSVLIKLDSFSYWLSACLTNNQKTIREYALAQITKMLQDKHHIKLSNKEKLSLLHDQNNAVLNNSAIENWLQTEQQSDIIIALYKKLNKPQLLLTVFSNKQNEAVQQFLLDQVEETSLLEKLQKKAVNSTIETQISQKLANLKEQAEKPIRVKKSAQLVLSKLLALRDQSDYEVVQTKQQQLTEQWQQLLEQFDCLADDEVAEFEQKHAHIIEQLKKTFAIKAEQFAQQQLAKQLADEQQQARDHVKQSLQKVKTQLTTAIFEHNQINESEYNQMFSDLAEFIQSSALNDKEKQQLQNALNEQQQLFQQLPAIEQAVTDATHLISKMSQRPLPQKLEQLNEKQQEFNEWLATWKKVAQQAGQVLPASIVSAQQEIVKLWQNGMAPLIKQQQQLFHNTQKRLNDINRLLSSGKFNACFAIHRKINQQFPLLSLAQQAKLQRVFDKVNEQVTDLSDWEQYIATPKKQALLNEMQALIETPLDNPIAQANKVKDARKMWNSFGHAEEDEALNKAFNELCEQAFAPCRLFYAEQDKIRNQHLKVRESILDKLQAAQSLITQESIDWKQLDSQINEFVKLWNEAGEVDREVYRSVNKQFNELLAPLKQTLQTHYQQNITAKEALISSAESLLEQDTQTAVEQVKQLQQQWKNIGYAGARFENKLWQRFRVVNDKIFAAREAQYQQQKSELSEIEQQFAEQLKVLEADEVNANTVALVNELQQKLSALVNDIRQQAPQLKRLVQQIEQYSHRLLEKKSTLKAQKKQVNWSNVFTVLEQYVTDNKNITEDELFQQLPTSWQKRLSDAFALDEIAQRADSTLELEILAGVESPKELQTKRREIQISLMQEKMTSGIETDLEQKFWQWLSLGKLQPDDLSQLARLKPIFCANSIKN
jgi:hypothetical protein